MILPDVNILLYSCRRDLEQHEAARSWLLGAIAGEGILLPNVVVVGVVRLATNPRVFATPSRPGEVVDFLEALRRRRTVRTLRTSDRHQRRFLDLCRERRPMGNEVPDVYLAALAFEERCRLASADDGFAGFADLDWVNPLVAGPTEPSG